MANLRQTVEKRAATWAQMQDLLTGDKELTVDERSKWDQLETELTTLTADKERLERAAKLGEGFAAKPEERAADVDAPAKPGDVADTGGDYARAFDAYVRFGRENMSAEQRQQLTAQHSVIDGARAQGELTGVAGGYSVPPEFLNKIVEQMKFYGGMLGNVEVVNTATGNDLSWMTTDGTTEVGALLAENTQVSEADVTLGLRKLGAYTYSSKLVRVSLQLLQDSVLDWQSFLATRFGQRLGRIINTHLTTGDGVNKPQGLITGGTTGKTTASATAITYGELIDLMHSIDVAYRTAGAKWMMHDLVLAEVRKLVDGQQRPLWEPSLQVGEPDSLLGYPLVINNDMDSTVAATKTTMAFGDFVAGYVVRQVAGGHVIRLDERYADYLQVGFMSFTRLDGLVKDASAYKLLVQHA